MTKRATAADVLLRAAEMADTGYFGYFAVVRMAAKELGVSDEEHAFAYHAAQLPTLGCMDIKCSVRVLALLFARELVLSGDV